MNKLNPNMIILGREVRGLNQTELSKLIDLTSANLSKMETGQIAVADYHIDSLVKVLRFPKSFFYQEGQILPSNLSYRKRRSVAQRLLAPIEAQMNITRLHVQQLLKPLAMAPADIPVMDIKDYGSPQKIATRLRKEWNIKEACIGNLTQLLESKGILVVSFNFGTERVDAQSILTEDKQPIIFVNKSLLGDRLRFSLAYELGHLIMHLHTSPSLDREVGHEANVFAAEFLMPEKEILPDFQGKLTIAKLGELKKKWKVSMQALLYRADDLGKLTANQKRYLLEQFNAMKIRRREPLELDIPKETPILLKKLITKYKTKVKMDITELATYFHLYRDEFIQFYGE
jgi:Zn-dependent peptidase ImmA (M78 family)